VLISAGPADQPALNIAAEHRAIRSVLRSARYRDELELHVRSAAQPGDLFEALCEDNATVLHVSTHGEDDGVALENASGVTQLFSQHALREAVATAADWLRVVVLGTCNSASTARALAKLIDCAIGVQGAIEDASVRAFSEAFYRAIAAGLAIDRAFQLGRSSARTTSAQDASRLRLFLGKGMNGSDIVLCGPSASSTNCTQTRDSDLTQPDHELLARVQARRSLEWELPERLESQLAELFPDTASVAQIIDEATRLLRRDRPHETCIHRGRVVFTSAWTAWATALSEAARISPRSLLAILLAVRRRTHNLDLIEAAIRVVLTAR
jgi:hypothetical protein